MKELKMYPALWLFLGAVFYASAASGAHMSSPGEGFEFDPLSNSKSEAITLQVAPGSAAGMAQKSLARNSDVLQGVNGLWERLENKRTRPLAATNDVPLIMLAENSYIGDLEVTMEIIGEDSGTADDIINTIELPVRLRETTRDRENLRNREGDGVMENPGRDRMEDQRGNIYESREEFRDTAQDNTSRNEYREDFRDTVQDTLQDTVQRNEYREDFRGTVQDSMNDAVQANKVQKGK